MFNFNLNSWAYRLIAFLTLFLVVFFVTGSIELHPVLFGAIISVSVAFMLNAIYLNQKKVFEDERTALIRNRSQAMVFNFLILAFWIFSFSILAYSYYNPEWTLVLFDHSILGQIFSEFLLSLALFVTLVATVLSFLLERFLSHIKYEK